MIYHTPHTKRVFRASAKKVIALKTAYPTNSLIILVLIINAPMTACHLFQARIGSRKIYAIVYKCMCITNMHVNKLSANILNSVIRGNTRRVHIPAISAQNILKNEKRETLY